MLKEIGQKTTELDKHCKDFGMNIHLVAVFLKKKKKKSPKPVALLCSLSMNIWTRVS